MIVWAWPPKPLAIEFSSAIRRWSWHRGGITERSRRVLRLKVIVRSGGHRSRGLILHQRDRRAQRMYAGTRLTAVLGQITAVGARAANAVKRSHEMPGN